MKTTLTKTHTYWSYGFANESLNQIKSKYEVVIFVVDNKKQLVYLFLN